MRKLLGLFLGGLVIFSLMLLTGCLNEPQSVDHTGKNDKFEIEYLFEKDGVKMYRFYDGGRYHYFTTNGETMSGQVEGKVTYEEHIERKTKPE